MLTLSPPGRELWVGMLVGYRPAPAAPLVEFFFVTGIDTVAERVEYFSSLYGAVRGMDGLEIAGFEVLLRSRRAVVLWRRER